MSEEVTLFGWIDINKEVFREFLPFGVIIREINTKVAEQPVAGYSAVPGSFSQLLCW